MAGMKLASSTPNRVRQKRLAFRESLPRFGAMPSSVQRKPTPAARQHLNLYFVTRYDPKTFRPVGETVPVEAESKAQAAERVCRFVVETAPLRLATVSVVAIGEPDRSRLYFRRA